MKLQSDVLDHLNQRLRKNKLSTPDEIGLLGATQIREIAAALDLNPSKSLGQNFVHDSNICEKIVKIAGVTGEDRVIEIGPGLGSLTLALLKSGAEVVAIEVDPRLADQLLVTAKNNGYLESTSKLRVIGKDALEITADEIAGSTKLVANLPYNISVPVILHFLQLGIVSSGIVMVQSEVAERLAAKPGSRIYGVPSVKLAWFASAHIADRVSRNVFWPVPRVDSSLLAFVTHQPLGSKELQGEVFALIDAAFNQRRKMLRSALSPLFNQLSRSRPPKSINENSELEELIMKAGIDPRTRAEQLTVNDFRELAIVLNSAGYKVVTRR